MKYTAPQKLILESDNIRLLERELKRNPRDKRIAANYYREMCRNGFIGTYLEPFIQEMHEILPVQGPNQNIAAMIINTMFPDNMRNNEFAKIASNLKFIASWAKGNHNIPLTKEVERLAVFSKEAAKHAEIYEWMANPDSDNRYSEMDLTPSYATI